MFVCLLNSFRIGLETSPSHNKKNSPIHNKQTKPLKPAIKPYKEDMTDTKPFDTQHSSITDTQGMLEETISDEEEPFKGKLYDAFANRVEDDFEKDFQGICLFVVL